MWVMRATRVRVRVRLHRPRHRRRRPVGELRSRPSFVGSLRLTKWEQEIDHPPRLPLTSALLRTFSDEQTQHRVVAGPGSWWPHPRPPDGASRHSGHHSVRTPIPTQRQLEPSHPAGVGARALHGVTEPANESSFFWSEQVRVTTRRLRSSRCRRRHRHRRRRSISSSISRRNR